MRLETNSAPACIRFVAGGGFGHWWLVIYNTNSIPSQDRIENDEADVVEYKCRNRIYVGSN